jgi:hypothetical protein
VSVFVVGAELLDLLPGEIEIPDFLLDLGLLPLVSVGGLGLVMILFVAPCFSLLILSIWDDYQFSFFLVPMFSLLTSTWAFLAFPRELLFRPKTRSLETGSCTL